MAKKVKKNEASVQTLTEVATILSVLKTCKSCVRFASNDKEHETVVTDVYVLNKALADLGNPDEIELVIRIPKKKTKTDE